LAFVSSIFKYFLKSPKKRIIRVCLNQIGSMSLLWFGYKCHNHLTTPCGHSYHSWFIVEHATSSLQCLLLYCGVPSTPKWCATWGIKPPSRDQNIVSENLGASKGGNKIPTRWSFKSKKGGKSF
jgi:hypothetical protein